MHGYALQEAGEEDLPSLAHIERSVAGLFPPGSIPDHIRSDALPMHLLREGLVAGTLWVVRSDSGTIAGYALLRIIENIALLAQIDVLPEYGRKGLGTALTLHAADAAAEREHSSLYLTTFRNIPWNAPFYSKLGFVPLTPSEAPPVMRNILSEELAAGLEDRVIMRRSLATSTG